MTTDNRTTPERFFSLSDLKGRGWTDGLIKRLLGEPDKDKRNPVFKSMAPMKLYDPRRVLPLEETTDFRDVRKRAGERKKAARRAVETKAAKMKVDLAGITIRVPRLRRDQAVARACEHYNDRAADRRNYEALADETCDDDFLDRITVNYLRHCLTSYEGELSRFFGRVGHAGACQEIKQNVLDAIVKEYPWLVAECERQRVECRLQDHQHYEKTNIVELGVE